MIREIIKNVNESQKFKTNDKVIYQGSGTDQMSCVVSDYDKKKDTYELQRLSDGVEIYDCKPTDMKKV